MINIINGNSLEKLKHLQDETFHCCVTSPPYWGMRNYNHPDQLGLEPTIEEYSDKLVTIFQEVKRVLKPNATLWLNLGDSYCSMHKPGFNSQKRIPANERNIKIIKPPNLKTKDLLGLPWLIAFALRNNGWYLRQDIIWSKPNSLPESVKDRCTKSHEYIFLFSKNIQYFFNSDAIKEKANYDNRKKTKMKGSIKYSESNPDYVKYSTQSRPHERWVFKNGIPYRNKRSVWTIPTQPFREAHFATFPEKLAKLCILAGSSKYDHILDPFAGSGTTGLVADKLQRHCTLIDINEDFCRLAKKRIKNDCPLFTSIKSNF